MKDEKKDKKHPLNIQKTLEMKSEKTAVCQDKFLKAYAKHNCNITKACKAAGVARAAYYDWINKDPNFKQRADEVVESFHDSLEAVMFTKALKDEDTTMLIWLSKTKLKQRGYVEKKEQEVSINPLEEVMKRVAQRKGDGDK